MAIWPSSWETMFNFYIYLFMRVHTKTNTKEKCMTKNVMCYLELNVQYQCSCMMLRGCTNDYIFVRVFAEDVFDYGVGICI